MELVLADLQRVMTYVKENETQFTQTAIQHCEAENQKGLELKCRKMDTSRMRMRELDTLFRKLYEDNALQRISDQQFTMLVSGYEDEKTTLPARVAELEKEIDNIVQLRCIGAVVNRPYNAGRFLTVFLYPNADFR